MDDIGSGGATPITNATSISDRSDRADHTRAENQGRILIGVGLLGVGLAALCCATPVVAALLSAIGLGAWLTGAGWILLALLVVGVGVSALILVRRWAQSGVCCEIQTTKMRM